MNVFFPLFLSSISHQQESGPVPGFFLLKWSSSPLLLPCETACSGVTLWVSVAGDDKTFRFSSNELFQLPVTGRLDASAVSNPELLFGS